MMMHGGATDPAGFISLNVIILLLWRINSNSQTHGESGGDESCSSCVVGKNKIRYEKLLKIKKKTKRKKKIGHSYDIHNNFVIVIISPLVCDLFSLRLPRARKRFPPISHVYLCARKHR